MHKKPTFMPALLASVLLVTPWARAHEVFGEETVTPVQNQKLPEITGKKVLQVVVGYAPGQASKPHRHAGSVFAYVLEGEVESQLEGQPAVVYKAGQSWYELPLAPHLVSRNASATKPARLLATLILDESAPTKEALPAR